MSDVARRWARRVTGLPIARKSVLNVLAGYADESGKAWPALGTIARDAGMSPRYARKQLRYLEVDHLIVGMPRFRQGSSGCGQTSTLYQLAIPPDELASDSTAPERANRRGRNSPAGRGGKRVPPVRTSSESNCFDKQSGQNSTFFTDMAALPAELVEAALKRKDESWLHAWLGPCTYDPHARTLHPRNGFAGTLIERELRDVLRSASVVIGRPLNSAPRPDPH